MLRRDRIASGELKATSIHFTIEEIELALASEKGLLREHDVEI